MWIVFAFSAAVFAALERTLMKGAGSVAADRTIVYSRYLIAAAIAILLLFFIRIPDITPVFYPSAVLACTADVLGIVFMSRALRYSDMGRVVPLLSFTPVFLLATSFVLLGEIPSLPGVIGVLIVVSGSYILHIESTRQSIWKPFQLLLKDKGARYMFATAFFFSLSAPFFKKALLNSSALFTLAVTLPFSTLLLTGYHLLFRGRSFRDILPNKASGYQLFGLGITVFFVALSVNLAFESGLVSYVVSIKRLSILLNIIIGVIFFQEKRMGRNLSAGTIMIAGAILILLN